MKTGLFKRTNLVLAAAILTAGTVMAWAVSRQDLSSKESLAPAQSVDVEVPKAAQSPAPNVDPQVIVNGQPVKTDTGGPVHVAVPNGSAHVNASGDGSVSVTTETNSSMGSGGGSVSIKASSRNGAGEGSAQIYSFSASNNGSSSSFSSTNVFSAGSGYVDISSP